MAGMTESCSVCGHSFEMQFRYQMEERDGGFMFFCSQDCHAKVVSGELEGGVNCAACSKRFTVELVSQVLRIRNERVYACSEPCRGQLMAEAGGARLGAIHASAAVPVPVPVPAPGPAPEPPPTPAPAPRWHFDGGASFIGSLGLLPGFGAGVYAGGLLEPPSFVPLQGFGAVWLDTTEQAGGPGRATFSAAFVGAGICPLRWRSDLVRAYACANGHVGMITSRGEGFDLPKTTERRLHTAGALEGRLSLRVVGPLALRAGVSAAVPLARDSFVYRRADGAIAEVFRMSPVVLLADLGFGVVLP